MPITKPWYQFKFVLFNLIFMVLTMLQLQSHVLDAHIAEYVFGVLLLACMLANAVLWVLCFGD